MKKIFKLLTLASLSVLLLVGCGSEKTSQSNDDDKLKVVTSFTIIEDIAREIAGDKINLHNLVPTGTDPHEYEPLPEDIKKATDADILFYNGLNLEGGDEGWFFKMIESVNQKEENIYNLTSRVEPMFLTSDDGKDEEINPHSFTSPQVGIKMAEDMRDTLLKKDPENKDFYEEQAGAYISKLEDIEKKYKDIINDIPEDRRILVTSERAFQYLAKDYGLKEGYIWAVDTEENGSPEQIKSLLTFIEENTIPILFVESNVDTRPMETVSKETGIAIADKPLYSDEIGQKGSEVDSYIKYLNYNIDLIYNELK